MKIIICLLLISFLKAQTSCDYSVIGASTQMGNFNTRAYRPLNVQNLFSELNSLRAWILTIYQLCFHKIIVDPDSLYPQDITGCFNGLHQVSKLQATYTGNYNKIKSQIDIISKIVFSTQNDCRPVLYYKGWNVTDDCTTLWQPFDNIITQYENDIILGGNGTRFINDMLLKTEIMRKNCGFNVLLKPYSWKDDTCQAANIDWLYPLVDQFDIIIIKKLQTNFTENFYNLYQSLYRAQYQCLRTQLQ